jgi:hypothetical protein
MQELLQQIDPDYYRSALLLIVRTELERLRKWHSAVGDVRRQSNITRGTPRSADKSNQPIVPTAIAQSCSSDCDITA